MMFFFGDSFTSVAYAAGGCSADQVACDLSYPHLYSAIRGLPMHNLARPGSLINNQASIIYSVRPAGDDHCFILLGTGDRRMRGYAPPALDMFRTGLLSQIVWLLSDVSKAKDWETTGTWQPSVYGIGLKSWTKGNTISFRFDGDRLILGGIYYDNPAPARFGVTIDGDDRGHFDQKAPVPLAVQAGMLSYTPTCWLFDCGDAREHECVLTVLDAQIVAFDWAASSMNGVPGHLINLPATALGDTASIAAYNNAIEQTANHALRLGFDVDLTDISKDFDITQDLCVDGLHPNNNGRARIASKLVAGLG